MFKPVKDGPPLPQSPDADTRLAAQQKQTSPRVRRSRWVHGEDFNGLAGAWGEVPRRSPSPSSADGNARRQ